MIQLDKSLFTYTPLFCEENVWKLIESLTSYENISPVDVLFIINHSNTVAIFNQNKSIGNQPVIWDYHVILSAQVYQNIFIFDFDSQSTFPVEINQYFTNTFPVNIDLITQFQPMLRKISAKYFIKHFFSDRSHMKNVIPDEEFPDYKIIQPKDKTENLTLDRCRHISRSIPCSQVLTPTKYLEICLTNDK